MFAGHMFRRSGATCLADNGIDIVNLKRMGRWSSEKCVEGYVEDSQHLKRKRMEGIMVSESNEANTNVVKKSKRKRTSDYKTAGGTTINLVINNYAADTSEEE